MPSTILPGVAAVVAAPNGYVNIFLHRAAFTLQLFSTGLKRLYPTLDE